MSDFVVRLRYGTQLRNHDALVELCKEAAAEIERLRAPNDKIREQLRAVLALVDELRAVIRVAGILR